MSAVTTGSCSFGTLLIIVSAVFSMLSSVEGVPIQSAFRNNLESSHIPENEMIEAGHSPYDKKWWALCRKEHSARGCKSTRKCRMEDICKPSWSTLKASFLSLQMTEKASANNEHANPTAMTRGRTAYHCSTSPKLHGESIKNTIRESQGLLVVAMSGMSCTEAIITALRSKKLEFQEVLFPTPREWEPPYSGPPTYKKGQPWPCSQL